MSEFSIQVVNLKKIYKCQIQLVLVVAIESMVFHVFSLAQTTVPHGIATSQVSLHTLPSISSTKRRKLLNLWVIVENQIFSFTLFLYTCLLYFYLLPSLFPPGGRGSYNDMGGPVITTQVTIPKDVSKRTVK